MADLYSSIPTPIISQPVDSLAELAAVANSAHKAGEEAARKGLENFRVAGEALLKAKSACRHGKWLPWLKVHCKFSDRTARDYMRLAENWVKVAAAANLRDALRLLAAGDDPHLNLNTLITGRNDRLVSVHALTRHPVADLFPSMSWEWERFVESIRTNGITTPLVLFPRTNQIIDGKERLRAAITVGYEVVPVCDADVENVEEAITLAISLNCCRMHVTKDQWAVIQVELQGKEVKATAN